MMTPRVRSDPIRSRARAPIDRAIRVSTLLDALFARARAMATTRRVSRGLMMMMMGDG
jgi:hypothetical protein